MLLPALLLAAALTPAPGDFTPVQGDFKVDNFRFADGAVLPRTVIHYTTLGTPKRDGSGHTTNAILILHGTGGSGQQFLSPQFADVLFGPGQPLDVQKWFVILPDGVGHGRSSKPSDGMHARFPHYDYGDMVELQYRLVTEGLHVDHLHLVMGTSMGGMHTWMWGERHPDFMDALVPLASAPAQIAGRNRMLRKMIMDDIRLDPEWNGGEYTKQPRGLAPALHVLLLMGSSPLQWQKAAPTRDEADRWLDDQVRRRLETTDANDMLYAFDASRTYDPSPDLEKIRAPLLAINSADDEVNPPELGIMEKAMPRVKRGRYVLLPTTPETRGHGTHTWAAVWLAPFTDFLQRVDGSVGSSRVDLQACKLEYSIVSPK